MEGPPLPFGTERPGFAALDEKSQRRQHEARQDVRPIMIAHVDRGEPYSDAGDQEQPKPPPPPLKPPPLELLKRPLPLLFESDLSRLKSLCVFLL